MLGPVIFTLLAVSVIGVPAELTFPLLKLIPIPLVRLPGVLPVRHIVAKLPAVVILLDITEIPDEFAPVALLVPLSTIAPFTVLVFAFEIRRPLAEVVPAAALPVIARLPVPVVKTLALLDRTTPLFVVPVARLVPVSVSDPPAVLTFEPARKMPQALFVPQAAVPVIKTLPLPVALMFGLD